MNYTQGDKESTLPKEHQEEIMQTSFKEFMSLKKGESIEDDSKIRDIDHELNQINPEASQFSRMLLLPDVQETAEHLDVETAEENLTEQILPPIQEKPMELLSAQEGSEIENIVVPAKAKDKNPMKSTELQAETENLPPIEDHEGKRPQDLSYGEESGNEGMSPEDPHIKTEKQDPQQISEEISESRIVNCTEEEVAEKSQAVLEEVNDSEEIIINNPTEGYVTPFMEETLTDSSSIKECSKKTETEIYESETITSDSGVYVDQLAEPTSTEATNKACHAGLVAETIPADTLANDELQSCQIRARENATISKMVKRNESFPESDLLEENVLQETEISAESISYDHDKKRNGFKTEESGCSFEGENVTREPYSRDQTSSTTKSSLPCLNCAIGNESASRGIDDISSFSDSENKERVDIEATVNMMQELENKKGRVPTETTLDDNPEEIIDDSCMVSEQQLDSLTIEGITFTDETGLMVDRKQKIPLLEEEDQVMKSNNVMEKACRAIGKKNTIEEENGSVCTPDKDTEDVSEFNYEEIQNDSEPGEHCGNDPDIVKHFDIVNQETEGTTSDHRGQNHENIGNEELHSIIALMSPEEDPEPLGVMGKIEDCANSEVGEKNATSESNVNVNEETSIDVDKQCTKSVDDLTHEEHNENQPLSVTCPETGAKDHDTINKVEDSDEVFQFLKTCDFSGVQEVSELQYTEETGINKDTTEENFQTVITDELEDHKNFENTNLDSLQQHNEPSTNKSKQNEESNECKELEHSGSNGLHAEDEIITEEGKPQKFDNHNSLDKEIEESADKHVLEDGVPYNEHNGVLADQVEAIDAGMDFRDKNEVEAMDAGTDSQGKNEWTTSESDSVKLEEDQREIEFFTYEEMAESNFRRDKELMSQEFEHDKLIVTIQSQKSLPSTESLGQNIGDATDDPTQNKSSEIVNDEALIIEVSQATGSGAEQIIQTNENSGHVNDISAHKSIQDDSTDKLQYITPSANGCENSSTSEEADKHGSTDHVKVVHCTYERPAEKLLEAHCENSTKEVDIVTKAEESSNKDQNIDQIPKDLEHNCFTQSNEKEGSQQDLLRAGSDFEEFQDINVSYTEHSENTEAKLHNLEVQKDEQEDENVYNVTGGTATVTEPPEIENGRSKGIHPGSGEIDQEIIKESRPYSDADNPIDTSQDEGTGESSEPIKDNSSDKLLHTAKSAVGGENNTTIAEVENYGSADERKVVDYTAAEKDQEANSENKGLTTKDADFVTEAEKSLNKTQIFDQEIDFNPAQLHVRSGTGSDNPDAQNDGEEVQEHDEQNSETLVDKSNEHEVIYANTSSSGNEMDTGSSEIKHDETLSLAEHTTEAPPGKSQISIDAVSPELSVNEQSMKTIITEASMQVVPQRSNNINAFVVNSIEVSQHKDAMEVIQHEISQGFEQDVMSSEMTCQKISPAIDSLRQNIGTSRNDPTQNEPSETVNDKGHIVELSKDAGFETEQHNQTNNKAAYEIGSSAEENVEAASSQSITISAVGGEINTTATDNDGSAYQSKIVDCTDGKSAEKVQEAYSDNQHSTIKEVEFVTEAEESVNKAQNFDQGINSNPVQYNESNGAPTDGLDVQNDGEEEKDVRNRTATVNDPETVNQRTMESHPGSENLNQEITVESIPYLDADESLTDNDEITRMSGEAAQIIEQDGSAADKQHNLEFEGSAITNHGAAPTEVIYVNTSSSENGMETTNSEVKHAVLGLEHIVHEQSTQRQVEEEAELDTNTPAATAKNTATVMKGTSLQDAPEQNNNVKPVVNSIEEIQYKNNKEEVSLMLQDPNHLASQDDEINKQPKITQSGNATFTTSKPSQYVQERGPDEAKEEENVSNVTTNCISDKNVVEMTPNEIVQTQGNQAVEPHEFNWPLSSASKATSRNQDREVNSMTLKDLNNEKEDPSQEKAKQNPCISEEAQRELQASTGFELRGDLSVVEEVSKTEEDLVPETPGTNDPIDSEEMEPGSCTEGFSQKIKCEADEVQQMVTVSLTNYARIRPVSENFEQTCKETTNNQEEAKSSEQVTQLNNKEQTLEDTIKDRGDDRVKGELIVEKSTADESCKSHRTSANDTSKEEQEKCIKTEVGTIGNEIQSINVEELKGRDANEARGSEGNTVRSKEMVFHEHGKINLSDSDQGIETDVDVESESSDPTKDNFTWISADEMQVSEEKRTEAINKHHNNPLDDEGESLNPSEDNFTKISADEIQVAEVTKAEAVDMHHTNPQMERTSSKLDAGTSEEVPSGYVEMSKSFSDPVFYKESKRFEEEIMEDKGEANADAEGCEPKFYEVGNDGEREEKLLHKTECNSKTDDCSISISRDEREYSKDVESKSLEGEDGPGTFQQATSEERTANEVSIMEPKMDATEISHEINAPEPDTMEIEKENLQEWAKVLDFSSVQEPQQRNDGLWFTDNVGNIAAAGSIGIVDLQGDFSSSRNPFMSTDNPAEIICSPEVKQSEIERPSLEQSQEVEDKLRIADSVRADSKELTSVFQDLNAETKSNADDSLLLLLNVKEDQDLNDKRKAEISCQLDLSSQTGSTENQGNSSSISNDNHTKTKNFEQVNEFQREKLATSEEIGKDTHRQSVKNYLIGERSPSNFEVHETATIDAREETKHNVNTVRNSAEVSAFGIKEIQPIRPNPSEEKVREQPLMENVRIQDSRNTQTMQVDKEEQLHRNCDEFHNTSQIQELCGKEPVDTVEDITEEGPEQQKKTGGSSITESKMNEFCALTPTEFVNTNKKEISAEELNEYIVVAENQPAIEKPKTEKEKQDVRYDLWEEDSEPKPVISETSRDTELKRQHKKSQFILSGMGSKMKHSISKVKKAMTCTSPQFPTDNVIVKLNKSKKS